MPLLIMFKDFLNFLAIKSLNRKRAVRKHSNAPSEEANDANKIPGKNPKSAPITKHNIAATGKANNEIKKYNKKKAE